MAVAAQDVPRDSMELDENMHMTTLVSLHIPANECHRRRGVCGSTRASEFILLVANVALIVLGIGIVAMSSAAASAYASTAACVMVVMGLGTVAVGGLGALALYKFSGLLYLYVICAFGLCVQLSFVLALLTLNEADVAAESAGWAQNHWPDAWNSIPADFRDSHRLPAWVKSDCMPRARRPHLASALFKPCWDHVKARAEEDYIDAGWRCCVVAMITLAVAVITTASDLGLAAIVEMTMGGIEAVVTLVGLLDVLIGGLLLCAIARACGALGGAWLLGVGLVQVGLGTWSTWANSAHKGGDYQSTASSETSMEVKYRRNKKCSILMLSVITVALLALGVAAVVRKEGVMVTARRDLIEQPQMLQYLSGTSENTLSAEGKYCHPSKASKGACSEKQSKCGAHANCMHQHLDTLFSLCNCTSTTTCAGRRYYTKEQYTHSKFDAASSCEPPSGLITDCAEETAGVCNMLEPALAQVLAVVSVHIDLFAWMSCSTAMLQLAMVLVLWRYLSLVPDVQQRDAML